MRRDFCAVKYSENLKPGAFYRHSVLSKEEPRLHGSSRSSAILSPQRAKRKKLRFTGRYTMLEGKNRNLCAW
jgi:hypothetical protein